jgi:hypothetical protein
MPDPVHPRDDVDTAAPWMREPPLSVIKQT